MTSNWKLRAVIINCESLETIQQKKEKTQQNENVYNITDH